MRIEIITHCWQYDRLLAYQLTSLCKYYVTNAGIQIVATVFYNSSDEHTANMLDWFCSNSTWIDFQPAELPIPELLNRSIGRNKAAIQSKADWVWFADCDYVFGPDSLSTVCKFDPDDSPLFFPRIVQTHFRHAIGDDYIQAVSKPGFYDIDPVNFYAQKMDRAIGGIQIVHGNTARKHGYCNWRRAQRPISGNKFVNPSGDVWYRKSLETTGLAVDIPNVYRIRHSRRFVTDRL